MRTPRAPHGRWSPADRSSLRRSRDKPAPISRRLRMQLSVGHDQACPLNLWWAGEQPDAAPGGGFGSGHSVHMIADSIRCDRDGPKGVGIMNHHLGRMRDGQMNILLGFPPIRTHGPRFY